VSEVLERLIQIRAAIDNPISYAEMVSLLNRATREYRDRNSDPRGDVPHSGAIQIYDRAIELAEQTAS
jgi:hypothetical protein